MDWNGIISDLEQKLSVAQAQVTKLERFLEDARELATLYGSNGASANTEPRRLIRLGDDWSRLTRAAAVRKALEEADGGPLSPSEIRTSLENHGRTGDKTKFISAQLNHMQARDEVVRRGRGEWFLKSYQPPGDPRIGDLLGIPRPEGGES